MTLRAAIVLLAALALSAATARLALWQLDRADQKLALQAAQQRQRALPPLSESELPATSAQAEVDKHRLVALQGRWLAAATVYLDNRPMNGRTGFYAVTPLQLADGSALLVQRGWLPRDLLDRTRIAAPDAPAGVVSVRGRIAPALPRLYEFDAAASGSIRQNLDIGAYARETGLRLRPLAIVQDDDAANATDGLLRQWPQAAADVHKHYGYAVQWFALCALTLGLYVWFQLIRPRWRRSRANTRVSD